MSCHYRPYRLGVVRATLLAVDRAVTTTSEDHRPNRSTAVVADLDLYHFRGWINAHKIFPLNDSNLFGIEIRPLYSAEATLDPFWSGPSLIPARTPMLPYANSFGPKRKTLNHPPGFTLLSHLSTRFLSDRHPG